MLLQFCNKPHEGKITEVIDKVKVKQAFRLAIDLEEDHPNSRWFRDLLAPPLDWIQKLSGKCLQEQGVYRLNLKAHKLSCEMIETRPQYQNKISWTCEKSLQNKDEDSTDEILEIKLKPKQSCEEEFYSLRFLRLKQGYGWYVPDQETSDRAQLKESQNIFKANPASPQILRSALPLLQLSIQNAELRRAPLKLWFSHVQDEGAVIFELIPENVTSTVAQKQTSFEELLQFITEEKPPSLIRWNPEHNLASIESPKNSISSSVKLPKTAPSASHILLKNSCQYFLNWYNARRVLKGMKGIREEAFHWKCQFRLSYEISQSESIILARLPLPLVDGNDKFPFQDEQSLRSPAVFQVLGQ